MLANIFAADLMFSFNFSCNTCSTVMIAIYQQNSNEIVRKCIFKTSRLCINLAISYVMHICSCSIKFFKLIQKMKTYRSAVSTSPAMFRSSDPTKNKSRTRCKPGFKLELSRLDTKLGFQKKTLFMNSCQLLLNKESVSTRT